MRLNLRLQTEAGKAMKKTANDIMTRDVHTVTESTPIEVLAKAFSEKGVSGFPVVDPQGDLVGVVTESDLIHQNQRLHIPTAVTLFDAVIVLGRSKRLEEEMRRMTAAKVGEIMTRDPVTVQGETPVDEIAAVMAENDRYTIPVLDEEGRLVGVVGKIDVIRSLASS
jgi:CBS domain-containing protein